MFELNRNHYFGLGLVLLLFGVQLRFVESYMLSEESTKFIAEKLEKKKDADAGPPLTAFIGATPTIERKVIRPPRWAGWSLMSIGAVLILHSLALKKPG